MVYIHSVTSYQPMAWVNTQAKPMTNTMGNVKKNTKENQEHNVRCTFTFACIFVHLCAKVEVKSKGKKQLL